MKDFKWMKICFLIVIGLLALQILSLAHQSVSSSWASAEMMTDGTVANEWNGAGMIGIPYGGIWSKNDYFNLYILADIFSDTVDTLETDLFSVFFDVDQNGSITSGIDRFYTAENGRFHAMTYSGASMEQVNTNSSLGIGFGPSIIQQFNSPKHRSSHRIWEIRIPLAELKAQPGETLHIGIVLGSGEPNFFYGDPYDFSYMFEIELASEPPTINPPVTPGEVLVKYKEGVSQDEIKTIEIQTV